MPLFKLDPSKIRCFNLRDDGEYTKTTLQNLVNDENKSMSLVEIQLFGINQVYTLIDFRKMSHEHFNSVSHNLSISRVLEDTPIIEGINIKSNLIKLDKLSMIDIIFLSQLRTIFSGLNYMSENVLGSDIRHYLTFGDTIDNDISESIFNVVKPNKKNWKYILRLKNNEYVFCQSIYTDDFEGVFIYVDNFNCWQYLSKKKYYNMLSLMSVKISYSIVDSDVCFTKVRHRQKYWADTLQDTLMYAIYIPIDIYFDKIFLPRFSNPSFGVYDALQLSVNCKDHSTSIILTHDELNINKSIYGVSYSTTCLRFMDQFCLLKLINNLISIKP